MQDVNHKLETDPDFIAIKRYKNSLAALEERYQNSIPDHVIALALNLTEAEVEERYQKIISCIRGEMGVS